MKTRIRNQYQDVRDTVRDKYQDTKEDIAEKYQDVRDTVIDKYQDTKEDITDRYQDVREEVKDRYDNVKERVEDKKEDLREDIREKGLIKTALDLFGSFMKNNIVLACLFTIQSVVFFLATPETSMTLLAAWIASLLVFAAIADVVVFIQSKKLRDPVSRINFIVSLAIACISVVLAVAAKYVAPVLPYLLGTILILNSLLNIFEEIKANRKLRAGLISNLVIDLVCIGIAIFVMVCPWSSYIQTKVFAVALLINAAANVMHAFHFGHMVRVTREDGSNRFIVERKDYRKEKEQQE